MENLCRRTGCENNAKFICHKCGLKLCEEHAISSPKSDDVYYCLECYTYLYSSSGVEYKS